MFHLFCQWQNAKLSLPYIIGKIFLLNLLETVDALLLKWIEIVLQMIVSEKKSPSISHIDSPSKGSLAFWGALKLRQIVAGIILLHGGPPVPPAPPLPPPLLLGGWVGLGEPVHLDDQALLDVGHHPLAVHLVQLHLRGHLQLQHQRHHHRRSWANRLAVGH